MYVPRHECIDRRTWDVLKVLLSIEGDIDVIFNLRHFDDIHSLVHTIMIQGFLSYRNLRYTNLADRMWCRRDRHNLNLIPSARNDKVLGAVDVSLEISGCGAQAD